MRILLFLFLAHICRAQQGQQGQPRPACNCKEAEECRNREVAAIPDCAMRCMTELGGDQRQVGQCMEYKSQKEALHRHCTHALLGLKFGYVYEEGQSRSTQQRPPQPPQNLIEKLNRKMDQSTPMGRFYGCIEECTYQIVVGRPAPSDLLQPPQRNFGGSSQQQPNPFFGDGGRKKRSVQCGDALQCYYTYTEQEWQNYLESARVVRVQSGF